MLAALPSSSRTCNTLQLLTVVLSSVIALSTLPGQTLARKGWAGSGITVDPWWKHATFYQINPLNFQDSDADGAGDIPRIADRLDYLQSLGVDAVILSPLSVQLAKPGEDGPPFFEKGYGSTEALDLLQREASLRHMRLLVDLPLSVRHSNEEALALARFWMSRGMGGLRLVEGELLQDNQGAGVPNGGVRERGERVHELEERVHAISRLCATYPGQRIVLVDLPSILSTPEAFARRSNRRATRTRGPAGAAVLSVDRSLERPPPLDASAIKAFLLGGPDKTASASVFASSSSSLRGTQQESVARVLAAALLLGRGSPLLEHGQELGSAQAASPEGMPSNSAPKQPGRPGITPVLPGPNAERVNATEQENDPASLLNWYRTLAHLRQANVTLRSGSLGLLDTGNPEVVVWVRRGPRVDAPAIFVAANLSAVPIVFSLVSQLRGAGLNPLNSLHPLASSHSQTASSYSASSISVAPGAVLVSELIQPGLESAPAPLLHHSRRRR